MERRCITSELCSKHSPVTSDSSSKHSHITSESSRKDSEITSESSRKDSEVTSESSRKDSEIASQSSRKHRHTTSESSRKDSEIASESSRKDSEVTSESSRKDSEITSESTSKHSNDTSGSSRNDSEVTLASSGKHIGVTSEPSREHCPSKRHCSRSSRKGACHCCRRHLRNSPLSSRQLGCLSSCKNSTVTRSGDMALVQKSSVCSNSKRSSEANSADESSKLKSSSLSCAKASAASGSSTECAVQSYIPLIVDVTRTSKRRGTNMRKVCSVLDAIMHKTPECNEMDRELDDYMLKVTGRKQRHANSLAPQTGKAKRSDTLATCKHKQKRSRHHGTSTAFKHKQKRSQHEHDTSAVINLGSDDEVEIIDTLHKTKSETVIIDLCSPSVKSKFPELTQKYTDRKDDKTSSGKQTCGERVLKEYVSVLDDEFRTSRNRPQVVPSVSGYTARHSLAPFASSVSASSACGPAVNSGVEKVQDCEVVFISGEKGECKTNSATAFGSSALNGCHSDERKSLQAIDNRMDHTTAPSSSSYGNNLYNPHPNIVNTGLRPIVIDGSNVAMGHTNGRIFSWKGLQMCIDYFLQRNHQVVAFVPKFRTSRFYSLDTDIVTSLQKQGLVTFTPSRKIGKDLVVSYDDRFIVQYAAECGGVIVSTDNYRDLLEENPTWRETIEKRLLMFTWVGDVLMFPQDPLGRSGPNLETFLRFPPDGCAETQ